MSFDHGFLALRDVMAGWPALKPPNRISVSEGAAQSMKIVRPGGGSGPWKPTETPYMVEPMDMLGRRGVSAVCFVGGAQAGKTVGLIEGWLTHAVVNDPGDMLIVQMTQDKAREYSKQRIDRLIRHSPDLKALIGSSHEDNTHDKGFKNGMWVRLAWPTVTNLSSTSYRYGAGTDYDRWPDDIDGEGDGFTLLRKRSTTYKSRGKTVVESTPGRDVKDPHWRPTSAHEAPPVGGILGIYNTSDRRRYYWPCPHCGEFFEASPGLGLFRLPPEEELLEGIRRLDLDRFVREHAYVACPACGVLNDSGTRAAMNRGGLWLPEGVTADAQRRLNGTARVSDIAGYWLGGVAASYLSWHDLLQRYLQALLDFSLTGQELKLLTTVNTDQGMPYTPRAVQEAARGRQQSDPRARTEDDLEQYVVPAWARFLVAAVDVQGGKNARFIVQVHAIGEHKEQALIDRFAITESVREGYGGKAPLDPAAHAEDWDVLVARVVKATYRVSGSDRELQVHRTIVDTGGEDGVTERAYAWFRRLRRDGFAQRVLVSKGEKKGKFNWLVRETLVGGPKGTKGDVPLKLLNASSFKDEVFNNFRRETPGPGYYHIPTPRSAERPEGWLLEAWFDELFAETRNADGSYTQIKKRNEALDLCYMALAVCEILGVNRAGFWKAPPAWAKPLDAGNSGLVSREARRLEQNAPPAVQAPAPRSVKRESRRSSYLD